MKKDFDGIIFDVDGTLWDSTPIVKDAWNKALIDCGIEGVNITADMLKGLFGLPMDDIIENILPNESYEKRMEFKPLCFKYEHDFLERYDAVLYTKIVDTIISLSKEYPVFIVSNCQAGYIELFLRKTGLGEYVTDHLCPGDTNLLKADNIKLICERHGINKPIYVGDTNMDNEACKKAKVPFVFASYGFGKVCDAKYIIEEPSDLVKMFL